MTFVVYALFMFQEIVKKGNTTESFAFQGFIL